MKRLALTAMAVCFVGLSATAIAESTNPYNGDWSASWTPPGAPGPVGAEVSFNNTAGTWRTIVLGDVQNNCVKFKHKVNVKESDAEKIVFIVLASQSLAGCPDATITAKRVDERHLEGKGASGGTITFTRAN
jgi:hypothetical protein